MGFVYKLYGNMYAVYATAALSGCCQSELDSSYILWKQKGMWFVLLRKLNALSPSNT